MLKNQKENMLKIQPLYMTMTVEERKQKIASLRALIEQKISESYKQQKTLDITSHSSDATPLSLFTPI